MKRYNPRDIEPKWQQVWADTRLYRAIDHDPRPKYYMMVEFPYPSGEGLHSGHAREYTLGDVMARLKRMQGYNVLFPMGYDAFGLPTENYAIKHNITPQAATAQNVANYRRQMTALGYSFDWDREVNTSDPSYYKWTQWLFLQFYKAGLAYQAETAINWCPHCKTGLANEEVVDGKHERCGTPVEKKLLKQWILKITAYADRLIEGLKDIDFPDRIASQQVNWIGRSEGAEIDFVASGHKVTVYTTRPDTLAGATFLVLAPEHLAVAELTTETQQAKVQAYVKQAQRESEVARQETDRPKTGVFTGATAKNPITGHDMPVWVADYVLAGYGTGAIMAVPAHDERDFAFAQAFDLPVARVVEGGELPSAAAGLLVNSGKFDGLAGIEAKHAITKWLYDQGLGRSATKFKLRDWIFSRQHYWGEPIPVVYCTHCAAKELKPKLSINFYDQKIWDALENSIKTVESRALNPEEPERYFGNVAVGDTVEFKNKDTGGHKLYEVTDVYRYRNLDELYADTEVATSVMASGKLPSKAEFLAGYTTLAPGYGERIERHGLVAWRVRPAAKVVPVPADQLPVELPIVEHYEPTDDGQSPLAAVTDWVNTVCPDCGGSAKRETDTMPNWAGSSWYYLRYMDPHNDQAFADRAKMEYWSPVDVYLGGMEHTTLHLLYSRFWYQFLYDQGLVPTPEPYAARRGQGIVLAADGRKMSKSLGNVVNPTDIIEQYGADALRLYVMFMAPYDESTAWSDERLGGVSRFLYRVWNLAQDLMANKVAVVGGTNTGEIETAVDRMTHKTLKKLHHDLHDMRFNTTVSALMEYVNFLNEAKIKAVLVSPAYSALAQRTVCTLVLMLAPSAPHLAEELWHQLGEQQSVHVAAWPEYDPQLIKDDLVTVVVQVGGKLRGTVVAMADTSEDELVELAQAEPNVAKHLEGAEIVKTVVVPRKLVNFVVKAVT